MTALPFLKDVAEPTPDNYLGAVRSKEVSGILNSASIAGVGSSVDLNHRASGGDLEKLGFRSIDYERFKRLHGPYWSVSVSRLQQGVKGAVELLLKHARKQFRRKVGLFKRYRKVVCQTYPNDLIYGRTLLDVQGDSSFGGSRLLAGAEYPCPGLKTMTSELLSESGHRRKITGDFRLLNKGAPVTTKHPDNQASCLQSRKCMAQCHSAHPKRFSEFSLWGKLVSGSEMAAANGFQEPPFDLLVWRSL